MQTVQTGYVPKTESETLNELLPGLSSQDVNPTKPKFNERMPKQGETVIFFPNPDDSVAKSNGATQCAAIVTQVWSSICVNLKIIPDNGPMQDRSSVTHFSANPVGYHFKFQDEV